MEIGGVLNSLPSTVAVQGNLSNELLLGDEAGMLEQVRRILSAVPRARHIFNLGHGIQQQTQISMVERLVAEVRARG